MSKALSVYTDEGRTIPRHHSVISTMSTEEAVSRAVMVVGGHPLVAQGIDSLLQEMDVFDFVLHAANAEDAIEMMEEHVVGLILVARFKGDEEGLSFLRSIREIDGEIPLIILAASESPGSVKDVVRAGASAYIIETAPKEVIIQSLNVAMTGEQLAVVPLSFISDPVASGVMPNQHAGIGSCAAEWSGRLTGQETNVLRLITEGMSNKEIARELDIFEGTVKVHVKSILRKLNAKNRTVAALMAVGAGAERLTP